MRSLKILIPIPACLAILTLLFNPAYAVAQSASINIKAFDDTHFIYTPREMLSFDIHKYLIQNAPKLAPYAENIAHWSAYSTISPKILITMMEYQTGIISKSIAGATVDIDDPFGPLSTKHGFNAQMIEISAKLSQNYYQAEKSSGTRIAANKPAGHRAIINTFPKSDTLTADQQAEKFSTMYARLFSGKQVNTADQFNSRLNKGLQADTPNAADEEKMQLPFPIGETWSGGGAHGYPVYSSLDFWSTYMDWGGDTSNFWVVAATGGTAVRHSSCSVTVIGPNGWETGYYHLDNVQITSNQIVSRNQKLANYANNENQAICNGGMSTGPHVHFSVTRDGKKHDLNGFQLSTFTIHTGREDYDIDCNYSWYERPDKTKVCPGFPELYNQGIPFSNVSGSPNILPQIHLLLKK